MFKMRPLVIFILNFLLMAASWMCYKFPNGDEYLVLFMIPLVFIVAPFVLGKRSIFVLFALNVVFLVFYRILGVLNFVDIFVLAVLFAAVAGGSYLVKDLYESFTAYHEPRLEARQKEYGNMVNELESIDRRGRKIESELSRISRLYEITKCLAPTLTMEDMLDALFGFLEDNFRLHAAHLLMFSQGELKTAKSKSVGYEDYYEDSGNMLDYEEVVKCAKAKGLRPFFIEKDDSPDLFESIKARSDTFMLFPLYVGDQLSAMLAIEGASRASYGRFRILISQIALELRKVRLYEQVQQLSILDGLTEVYLRRYLMERLEEEVERASRLGLVFSIGMVDVDHFKECNDRYGHLVGDVVLKKISEKLRNSVREVDMIARYGGEEFCVVLPETTKDLALSVAERLRKNVESDRIKAFDENIRITISIGISTYPEDGKDVGAMIEKADTALYAAKRKGRNRVCGA